MFEFFTISMIILLGVISPGPDFAIVSCNSLRYTRKTGVMTALGVACGSLLHSAYCIFGLAIIISNSLLLFSIIKYIGAAYLIYLGGKGIFSQQVLIQATVEKSSQNLSLTQAFRQGLFCNLLNPKSVFFFLALFTTVIKPSMPIIVQIGYGFEITLIDSLWFSIVASLFSNKKIKILLGRFLNYVTKLFGGFLIIFGLKIATLSFAKI